MPAFTRHEIEAEHRAGVLDLVLQLGPCRVEPVGRRRLQVRDGAGSPSAKRDYRTEWRRGQDRGIVSGAGRPAQKCTK